MLHAKVFVHVKPASIRTRGLLGVNAKGFPGKSKCEIARVENEADMKPIDHTMVV